MVNDYTHKIVIKEDGVQSLIIVPALPKDAGEWTVIAQNRAGRTSVAVTLNVDGGSGSILWSVSKSQEQTARHSSLSMNELLQRSAEVVCRYVVVWLGGSY